MKPFSRVGRYWHTLKHLKPVQFYGRLWLRLNRPGASDRPAPVARASTGIWQLPAMRAPSMTGPRHFRFLNEDGVLERGDWEDGSRAKLWLYNLHYFDDLNAQDASLRDAWHAALMDDWILNHRKGTGWEPYPSSLRIVNWSKRHLRGRVLSEPQRDSLANQVRWLRQCIEWHLLGNHLFVNAKALVYAGLMFEGDEADRWLADGLKIVNAELPEQVLPDGGNFERSPMYHAIFLEDLLDLLNAAQAFPGRIGAAMQDEWRRTAARMVTWLRLLCHADGEIALFNDAAIGVAPSPHSLIDYAARLGIDVGNDLGTSPNPRVSSLPDSGYIRIDVPAATALLDVAPVGPDYLPGHAHADTLSFELSVFGRRVVVNGGTSRYGIGPERLRERGTAAHSTLIVDGQDSSEVWAGFRVARRARPFDLGIARDDDSAVVACSHDGYRRLAGRPIHRRQWRMGVGRLEVHDRVEGRFTTADARFHFHPDLRVTLIDSRNLLLSLPGAGQIRMQVHQGALRLEPSRYAPAFGQLQDTLCAVVGVADAQARTEFEWA